MDANALMTKGKKVKVIYIVTRQLNRCFLHVQTVDYFDTETGKWCNTSPSLLNSVVNLLLHFPQESILSVHSSKKHFLIPPCRKRSEQINQHVCDITKYCTLDLLHPVCSVGDHKEVLPVWRHYLCR